jgi:hypothetical protein
MADRNLFALPEITLPYAYTALPQTFSGLSDIVSSISKGLGETIGKTDLRSLMKRKQMYHTLESLYPYYNVTTEALLTGPYRESLIQYQRALTETLLSQVRPNKTLSTLLSGILESYNKNFGLTTGGRAERNAGQTSIGQVIPKKTALPERKRGGGVSGSWAPSPIAKIGSMILQSQPGSLFGMYTPIQTAYGLPPLSELLQQGWEDTMRYLGKAIPTIWGGLKKSARQMYSYY